MRGHKIKQELSDSYRSGDLGYYLQSLAKHRHDPEIIEDEAILSNMVNAGRALILQSRIDVVSFITKTNDVIPKPWTRIGEEPIAAMIGMLIKNDDYHHMLDNHFLPILKSEWGGNKVFMDAVCNIVGVAYGVFVEQTIKQKKRQREENSYSSPYSPEEIIKYISRDFPEILSQVSMPLAMYLNDLLSDMPTQANLEETERLLDLVTPEELQEFAIEQLGLTPDFNRQQISQKLLEVMQNAPYPEFFILVRDTPFLWQGVVEHCLKYPDEFPLLAKNIGAPAKASSYRHLTL